MEARERDNAAVALPEGIEQRGAVAGLFADRATAERAIEDLTSHGFNYDSLGVAMADRDEQRELLSDTGAQTTAELAEGGTGMIGAITHLFNPPKALAGEELRTALSELGLSEADARYFEQGVTEGQVLISVRAMGPLAAEAITILARNGADVGFPVPPQSMPTGTESLKNNNFFDMGGV